MKQTILTGILLLVLLVMAGCSSAVNDTIAAIDAIAAADDLQGKRNAVDAATELYNSLDDGQKEKVTNSSVLRDAQAEVEQLDKAQAFAEKLFTRCAKTFNNSESIKLKNVWYCTDSVAHHFTFEFTWKNDYGFTETLYYGGTFMDMDDEAINNAAKGALLPGGSPWFKEGKTFAMDSSFSVKLDAAAIQTYFLRNR